MGQEVEHLIAMYESVPVEGNVRQYELQIDSELTWSGAGDDRVDALLEAIAAATGQSDEIPNNQKAPPRTAEVQGSPREAVRGVLTQGPAVMIG